MLKKIITLVATAALTVTGFTVMPASATSYAPNANSTANSMRWEVTIPADGQVSLPSSASSVYFSRSFEFNGTSLPDAYGKTVSIDWSITKPDNTVINSSNSQQNNFYAYHSASLYGNGSYHDVRPMGGSPVVITGPDEANYETAQIRFSLSKLEWTGPAGVYTVSIVLKLDGVAYTNFTASGPNSASIENNDLSINSNATVGTNVNVEYLGLPKAEINTDTCVNTSTLSVGNVLTLRQIVNGSQIQGQASGVMRNVNAFLRDASGSNYVNTDFDGTNYTVEVNQAILTSGLSIDSSLEFLNPAGSDPAVGPETSLSEGPHNVGLSVTNAAGVELTMGCLPPTPATPVATLSGDLVRASATGVFRSSSNVDYSCEAFRASDGSALGIETYANTMNYDNSLQANTRVECNNFFGLPGGTSVVIKIVAESRDVPAWKSFSAASNTVTVPSNGITFTSTASNGNNFGQVKARTPIDIVSLSGGGMQSTVNVTEPTGGIFEFNRKGSNLTLRRITATGLDSNFGTVPFTHTSSSYSFSAGFNGTLAAPRPIVSLLAQQVNPDLVLRDFTYQGAAGNTRTVTSSQLSSLCTSSFGSTFVEINRAFIVSTPTTDAYVQVGCSTPWSQNTSSTEGWALVKVSMTGNSAPELVTKLGTGTASFPGFVTGGDMSGPGGLPVSLHWSATGTQPMLSFLVAPENQTCSMNGCSSTYSSPKIVRIPANGGAATTTNSGISVPTSSADSMHVEMGKVNFGTILISKWVYGTCGPNGCGPSTQSQFKATATGGATPLTVTWDTTAGISNASSVIDTTLGLTQDGQLVFVRAGSTAGAYQLKMARLNLSTGAVTTFGELISYTRSGMAEVTLSPLGGNSVAILAPSGVNAGKLDYLVGVGGGASEPVAPTIPTPNGDAETDLGRSLNIGGTRFAIDGTGLNVVSKVLFGTVEASFTKTATQLRITVPRGTTGTAPVTIVYSGGSVPVGDWVYMGDVRIAQTLTPTGLGDPTHSGASEANRNFSVASSIDGYTPTVVSTTPAVCLYVAGEIDFVGNGTCVLKAAQVGDAVTAPKEELYEIYYESTILASALQSTDAGKTTITLTGVGLTSVSKVLFGTVEVTPSKKTATSLTLTVPAAPSTGATVGVSLKYANGTVVDTELDFEYVGAAKLAQTIELSIGADTYESAGDPARPVVTASVNGGESTGLTVSVVSKTPLICTVTQGILAFVGAGTCTVEASQAGNAGYLAAQKVTRSIYVVPVYNASSALYSTDAGKPTIVLTGTGLTSVTKIQLVNSNDSNELIEVTGANLIPNKTGTSLTVKVPVAGVLADDVADLKMVYGPSATVVDTADNFEFVGATKLSQVLNFTPATSVTYGDAMVTLTPTSTVKDSNPAVELDVAVTITTTTPKVCSVIGYQLRYLTSGTCALVASQAGNAGLNKATDVKVNITVAKKAQTITVADSTLEVTDASSIDAGATLSHEELAIEYSTNNDSVCTVDGTGVISGLMPTSESATCVITVSQAGDLRYLAAESKTIAVTITSGAEPEDILPEEGDGNGTPAASIGNGGLKTFTETNDTDFQLAWDRASGRLVPRTTGVYIGHIQATLTFTKDGINYSCTNVFGSTKKYTVSKLTSKNAKTVAAQKKLAMSKKIFVDTAFCTDTTKLSVTSANMTKAGFPKIKPSADSAAEKAAEKLASAALKGFTGSVTIKIQRYRAWPTTGLNYTGYTGAGKRIPATTRVTTVNLG